MRRALVALAAVVAALAIAGVAEARPVVAIQDDKIHTIQPADMAKRVQVLAATGTRWTRVDIHWNDVAKQRPASPTDPNDPAYDWGIYDTVLKDLQARGIQAVATFYGTPAWATPGGAANAAPPPADAAAFAGALARRYNGQFTPKGAQQPLPEVRRIGVWNEPNIAQFYSPQCRQRTDGAWVPVSPTTYGDLLRQAYARIKAANKRAIVIGGEAGPVGTQARGACASGQDSSVGTLQFAALLKSHLGPGRAPLDVWGQHLYPIGPPARAVAFPAWNSLPKLMRTVDRLHPSGKMPIYVTETSYHTSYNRFHRYFVTEKQQAAWLTQTYTVAARNPRVQLVVWFNLQDNPFWTGGLLRADGTKKPSYTRFQTLARRPITEPGWEPQA